jgi:hypothetical protein
LIGSIPTHWKFSSIWVFLWTLYGVPISLITINRWK